MNTLISINIKIFFFLCFFISFTINFQEWNWGLQFSWIFAFLAAISIGGRSLKVVIFQNNAVFSLLRFFIFISIFDLLLVSLNVIHPKIDSNYDVKRLIFHNGYIIVYSITCIAIYNFFRNRRFKIVKSYENYLTIYPFVIISLYGVYQLLSTYEIVPYTDIFNNSLSTGFTYYRFVDDHRISSIFAEPSEYSYYLCFILPILYRYIRFDNCKIAVKIILGVLLLTQIVCVKSLTFLVGFPIDILVILIFIEKIKITNIIKLGFISVFGIVYISWERIIKIISNEDGSVRDRARDFESAIDLFQSNLYTGFGYGGIRGMDGISFLLASFGVIGISITFFMIYRILSKIYVYDKVVALSIFSMVFSSLSSNNIFDYIFIWILFLYFYILATKSKNLVMKK